MTIGDRLKFEREKRVMTQVQFANILEMKQGQYSRIEMGTQGLTVDKLLLLNKKLGIDVNYIISGEYTKFNYNLDKMEMSELKKLHTDIFNEIESRLKTSNSK